MQYSRENPGHQRIATLDIETTHYEPAQGEIVSIGVGVHDRGDHGEAATYETFHRGGDGDPPGIDHFNEYGADGLVSYKGLDFNMDFIGGPLERLGETVEPPEIAAASEVTSTFRRSEPACRARGSNGRALRSVWRPIGFRPTVFLPSYDFSSEIAYSSPNVEKCLTSVSAASSMSAIELTCL